MPDFTAEGGSVTFWLKIKPRASRERLRRGPQGELILEVHAPPTAGQANEACARFLAEVVGLPRGAIEIRAGKKSRRKLIRISGGSPEAIVERLRFAASIAPNVAENLR